MNKGLVSLLSIVVGGAAGAAAVTTMNGKVSEKKEEKINKFKSYYSMLNQWLIVKQEGKSLAEKLISDGYKTIAIYGMGEMGNRLYDELKNTEVEIKYAIDKEAGSTYAEIDVKDMDDELEQVDAIIVSAIFAFDSIEKELKQKVDYSILSLEDLIYEL